MKKLLLWLLMGALMEQSVCWGADGGKENEDWAEGEHMVKLVRDKVGDTKRYYFWVKYGSLEAAVTEILSWDKKQDKEHYNVSYQEARGFLKQFEHEFYLNGDPPKLKLPECKNFYQGEKKGWMIRNDKELGDLYDTKNNQEVEAEIVFIDKNKLPSQEIAEKILTQRVRSLKLEAGNWAEESLNHAFTDSTNQKVKEEIKDLILIAQPNLENKDTLSDSIAEGKIELAEFLIENKGKLNINLDKKNKDKNGKTSLHMAVGLKNPKMVELLLKNNANPNIQDKYGKTSLHMAVMMANTKIVKMLLENKADPNIKDNNGKTPMALLSDLPSTKKIEIKKITQLLKDASFKPKPVSGLSTSKKVGIALIVSLGGLAILYKGYYLLFSQKPSKKEKGEAEKTEAKQKV